MKHLEELILVGRPLVDKQTCGSGMDAEIEQGIPDIGEDEGGNDDGTRQKREGTENEGTEKCRGEEAKCREVY